jgi:hypothetical protein
MGRQKLLDFKDPSSILSKDSLRDHFNLQLPGRGVLVNCSRPLKFAIGTGSASPGGEEKRLVSAGTSARCIIYVQQFLLRDGGWEGCRYLLSV